MTEGEANSGELHSRSDGAETAACCDERLTGEMWGLAQRVPWSSLLRGHWYQHQLMTEYVGRPYLEVEEVVVR